MGSRWDEVMELLTKLLTTSKQVFGSDHKTTKGIVWALNKVQNGGKDCETLQNDEVQRRKFTKWKIVGHCNYLGKKCTTSLANEQNLNKLHLYRIS